MTTTTSSAAVSENANIQPSNNVSLMINRLLGPMLNEFRDTENSNVAWTVKEMFRTMLIGMKTRGLAMNMHDWDMASDVNLISYSLDNIFHNAGMKDTQLFVDLQLIFDDVLADQMIQPADKSNLDLFVGEDTGEDDCEDEENFND